MSSKNAVGFAELPQFALRKEPLVSQKCIERQAAMALAQNTAVAARPPRIRSIVFQHVIVENSENLHERKRRAQMAAIRSLYRFHDLPSKLPTPLIQRRRVDGQRLN